MRFQARRLQGALLGLLAALPLTLALPAAGEPADAAVRIAQADEADPAPKAGTGKLEARYSPREPEEKSWYNTDYLFGMTRGVTGSTLHPAVKLPLFVLTVPLDLAFLPFAAIGGLFG